MKRTSLWESGALVGMLSTSALLLVFKFSAREEAPTRDRAIRSPIIVLAVGHDFEWRFQYAGRDGQLGTADDFSIDRRLQLPPNADIELRVTSDDNVYTLSDPTIGINTIAVPGLIDVARFRTPREGTIELFADPLCGFRLYHDDVMGRMTFKMPQTPTDWFGERTTSVQGVESAETLKPDSDGVYHVYPNQDIQDALDAAAGDDVHKLVQVHAGVYRPRRHAQALIQFNARHDGITLEAVGKVTLTAANSSLADKSASSFPAVVNHVVYFGDGVSRRTVFRGFRVTGANQFITNDNTLSIEPNSNSRELQPGMFFYMDGGAIKMFGRSYPTILDTKCIGNRSALCGGAVSIEHRGFDQDSVRFQNCVFEDNHCPATGAAIDLLQGSSAIIENCLFVGNIGNTGMDRIARDFGLTYNGRHGCGALTVFPESKIIVKRCTFTANWNGVDDRGMGNVYVDNVFWMNDASDGSRTGTAYEIDIMDGRNVTRCFFGGQVPDLRGTVSQVENMFGATDPEFDSSFIPHASEYSSAGYRPPEGEDL